MLKIAIVGRTQRGARFAAFRLQRVHGFERKKMMYGVTRMIRLFYKYDRMDRWINWEKKVEFYDALYNIDPNIHIDYLLKRISYSVKDVIVEDARYLNEAKKLKESGFKIIRMNPSERRRPSLKGFSKSAPGLVQISEFYGNEANKIEADYSVTFDTLASAQLAIDRIVERLREIEYNNSNRTQGGLEDIAKT